MAVKKLGGQVNSSQYDEVSPIISHDEKSLFFTRIASPDYDRTLVEHGEFIEDKSKYERRLQRIYSEIAGRHITDPVASSFNQDIWIAALQDGNVSKVSHPKYPLNSALPNSMCSRFDENRYVVMNEYGIEGGMHLGFSIVEAYGNNQFTHPEPISIDDFDVGGEELHFTISDDQYYIILAMENKDGYGGKDLYYVVKTMGTQYGKPINLGPSVNTPYDESTPRFDHTNKKLYFSSNRPGGLGKSDIYVSYRLDYSLNNWSDPELLPAPINSKYNDAHPYLYQDDIHMLFSSDRDGSSDIYYAYPENIEELMHSIKIIVVEEIDGEIRNVGAEILWSTEANNQFDGYFRSYNGLCLFTFENDRPIQFKARNRRKSSHIIDVFPKELLEKGERQLIIKLNDKSKAEQIDLYASRDTKTETKVSNAVVTAEHKEESIPAAKESNAKDTSSNSLSSALFGSDKNTSRVLLHNIYFERSQPIVLPTSYPALDELASVLRDNPTAEIMVEGHTDNVGGEYELLQLSEQRAESIVAYLISKGVSAKQLHAIGYGGHRPLTKNRNEAERRKNRRVEITVLKQPKK